MNRPNTIRFGLNHSWSYGLVGLVLCGASYSCVNAQSAQPSRHPPAKPSAAVSSLPAAPPTATNPSAEPAPSAPAAAHAVEVDYADGKLAVKATNASLNEILREVSHKTGMKITGGVVDDRVFGDYGPSAPTVVLDALLEGTGSNILLVDDAKGGSQLILTPRRGGVTPPNPNAGSSGDSEENTPTMYIAPERPFQPPTGNGRGPAEARPDSETAPNGDPTEGSAPKTPQQIYEQLQQTMQQQQQSQPPPPSPPDQE